MYGVVLWSDPDERNAVIWCEDHGELAFLEIETTAPDLLPVPAAGDLIQFEIDERNGRRWVRAPELVAAEQFPDIGARLIDMRKRVLSDT